MLIISLIFILLSNAFTLRRDKSILYSRIAIISLLYSIFICLSNFYINIFNTSIGLYNGLFFVSFTNSIFTIFIFIVTTTILHITGFYSRKVWSQYYSSIYKLLFFSLVYPTKKIINKTAEHFTIIEYSLMLLFIITGGVLLISTNDLISMYLSIELQSYGLYLLSAFYRNSELSTFAGLTYFLLGGLSSSFILLGASLLYVNSGTTTFDNIYILNNIYDVSKENSIDINWYNSLYIQISLTIMSVGFLFKVSAAPFHFWSPEVYDGIPTIVTTFVAIIAKISIFIFMLELAHNVKKLIAVNYIWTTSLLVSSLLSLIIGAIVGLTQSRIKRLFAYSTISHVGFILLALSINSIESTQAFIFYLIQYTISNLNAFILLLSIGFTLYFYTKENMKYKDIQDKNNSPIQIISQIKGYFYVNPLLALSLAITLFSFVGVPPLIGFFGKQMVLSAALDYNYTFVVLFAIITSVISCVYYLNIIKEIFFKKEDDKLFNSENTNLCGVILPNEYTYNYFNNESIKKSTSKLNEQTKHIKKININPRDIKLSGFYSITSSIFTLIILLFVINPTECINIGNIISINI